ncbi:hypothetical protein NDA00_26605 [Funiculus sociatus GB2-M2]|uniref:hypothetical protein n=1 Tax=Funiculus sociatus TaxID=450527 RepID=UPI0032991EF5
MLAIYNPLQPTVETTPTARLRQDFGDELLDLSTSDKYALIQILHSWQERAVDGQFDPQLGVVPSTVQLTPALIDVLYAWSMQGSLIRPAEIIQPLI